MSRIELLSRRTFLGGVFSAGALVLSARLLPEDALAATAQSANTAKPLGKAAASAAWAPSVYLGLETDGSVIIVAHRSEMGTGIRTGLPMVVADELDADWQRVRVEQALGDRKYGSQNTDGSCSIRDFYDAMREAGATARLMLELAAAQQWGVPVAEVKAQHHKVIHTPSRRELGFGALVATAAKLPVPKKEELKFKSAAEYRYIGKDVPMVDRDDICAGKGTFGIDARMPGMVYASIERSPVLGGKIKSYDDKETKKVRGVEQTVVIPDFKAPNHGFQALGGIAVIANSTWAAMKGREALTVEWEKGENASYDSAKYKEALFATVRQPQKAARTVGDVDAEFAKGGKTHEAEYYVPHLSHAPMEPPAAVADVKDGKAVIYAATQNPQAVQTTVASTLGIKPEDVECHVTLLGGGFGRKSKPDYVAEAALLSKAVGKPVKVTWSREDDIRFDYYHTVSAMYMKAAVDDKGRPTAWLQRCAFPSMMSTFNATTTVASGGELGMGWTNVPFDIANLRAENGPAKHHVRLGWLRSVANIQHAFAVHSFADELAHHAKRDPVEYLLDLIGSPRKIAGGGGRLADKYPFDTGRLRTVIELAAERSGWAKKKPAKGRALGIAAHYSFLSYVAAVVEVEVDSAGKIRIPRVDMAVDVGRVISPDRVKSQFEGAAVFGASIALMSAITAANGEIQQSNFYDYQVARIPEAPIATHVHIVASDAPPAGVGEPGVPPIPPAICNAIFAATGKRIRHLPIRNQLA